MRHWQGVAYITAVQGSCYTPRVFRMLAARLQAVGRDGESHVANPVHPHRRHCLARCRSGRCRRLQVQRRSRATCCTPTSRATLPAERLNIQSQKTDTVAVQTRQQEELKRLQDADKASQQASQRRQGSAAGRADERDPESRPVHQGAPALRQLHEFAAALRAGCGRPAPLSQRCRARPPPVRPPKRRWT